MTSPSYDTIPKNGQPYLQVEVGDELYDELNALAGQRIVHAALWEESLDDALKETETDPNEQTTVDIDLYLQGDVYFELYGTLCYPDLDSHPLKGVNRISQHFNKMIDDGLWLDEVAVDDEDQLALILSQNHKPVLYLSVSAWILDEWDELPT